MRPGPNSYPERFTRLSLAGQISRSALVPSGYERVMNLTRRAVGKG
jgi:hypothetical protein